MAGYEYRVVPAPAKGMKARGVKAPEARFALALQELMNEMGRDGWEYQRAETLPSVERSGLTGSTTNWRHVLVFRRALQEEEAERPLAIEPPRADADDAAGEPEDKDEDAAEIAEAAEEPDALRISDADEKRA